MILLGRGSKVGVAVIGYGVVVTDIVFKLRARHEEVIRDTNSKAKFVESFGIQLRQEFVLKKPIVIFTLVDINSSYLNSCFIVKR